MTRRRILVWCLAVMGGATLLPTGCTVLNCVCQLAECQGERVQTTFTCPRGKRYRLLLGVPQAADKEPFSGQVRVTLKGGKPVYQFAFSAKTAQKSDCLDSQGLTAFILTWRDTDEFQHLVRPGQTYDLVVDFDQQPPAGSSLWLSWVK